VAEEENASPVLMLMALTIIFSMTARDASLTLPETVTDYWAHVKVMARKVLVYGRSTARSFPVRLPKGTASKGQKGC
jgi:hypothetical protein